MNKLEVILKQHTPLIHFQHEQDGATLRGSEVKPKLDRFIIKNLFNNNFDECKYYLIGYSPQKETEVRRKYNDGFRALDYKIKVIVLDKKKVILQTNSEFNQNNNVTKYYTKFKRNEDFPFLLSNMGGKESKKDLINLILYDYILLEFSTRHKFIREALIKCVISFFSRNNFGQRKTKGFGSFTVAKIEETPIDWSKPLMPSGTLYMKFSVHNHIGALNKQYALFKTLDFYWKCLKSGVNYTRNEDSDEMKLRYIKAFYWHYLNRNGHTWEKKTVKESFNLLTGKETHTNNALSSSYARALLGSADKFEYKDPLKRFRNCNIKIEHSETDEKKRIGRIPSPIIFKPIIHGDEVTIYILFDPNIRPKLRELTNLRYKFSSPHHQSPLFLEIDPGIIDSYKEMLISYHQYFTENDDVATSVFYEIKDKRISNTMVPRDYNWNNILEEEEIVTFSRTE